MHALRGVACTVAAGELVAVMGPSGSGKSTLLTLAGGLDSPTGGTVASRAPCSARCPASELAALRRRSVGYVFQDFNLIPALTAAENVALPRELDGDSTRAARRLALTALDEVGIAELADRFPDDMSGGQQQRVAIARAMVGDRRLVLADEPTGALDTETGEEVLRLLRARCDAGAAGVLVTHEARHAAWADRVVFLRDGLVVDETGPRTERRVAARRRRSQMRLLRGWRPALRIARREARARTGPQRPRARDGRAAGARHRRAGHALPDSSTCPPSRASPGSSAPPTRWSRRRGPAAWWTRHRPGLACRVEPDGRREPPPTPGDGRLPACYLPQPGDGVAAAAA